MYVTEDVTCTVRVHSCIALGVSIHVQYGPATRYKVFAFHMRTKCVHKKVHTFCTRTKQYASIPQALIFAVHCSRSSESFNSIPSQH